MSEQTAPGYDKKAGDNASAIMQVIGGGLAVVGMPFIVIAASLTGRTVLIVSVSIYAATLLYWFSISAIAHFLRSPRARKVVGALEDAGALALLAGAFMPFCLAGESAGTGWTLFGLLWGLGAMAFLWTLLSSGKARELALTLYYLAFALVLPLLPPFRALFPAEAFPWVVLAGLLLAGSLFFRRRDRMPYHHAIWHSFAGMASILYYFALFQLV